MRSFFQFIVVLALAVCGYLLYPVVAQSLRAHGCLPPEPPAAVVPPEPPEPRPEPEPQPIEHPQPPPQPPPTTPDNAGGTNMPRIKTLEEITQNWKKVPAKAFPKRVMLKSIVAFATPAGASMKMSEGREAVPLDLSAEGMLTLSSGEESDMRAVVPVDETDFKARVTKRYDEGMEKLRAAAGQGLQERPAPPPADGGAKPDAGEAPAAPAPTADERYLALMRESVANGGIEGVTPEKVKAWRWIGYEEIGGVGYWTGTATITKKTYFGEFDTEAKALIRDEKVERWVLPGVGE